MTDGRTRVQEYPKRAGGRADRHRGSLDDVYGKVSMLAAHVGQLEGAQTDIEAHVDDLLAHVKSLETIVDHLTAALASMGEPLVKAELPPKDPPPPPPPHRARAIIQTPRTNFGSTIVLDAERGLARRVAYYTKEGIFDSFLCFNKVTHPGKPGRYLITVPVFWRGGLWAIKPYGATLEPVGYDVFALPKLEGEDDASDAA